MAHKGIPVFQYGRQGFFIFRIHLNTLMMGIDISCSTTCAIVGDLYKIRM